MESNSHPPPGLAASVTDALSDAVSQVAAPHESSRGRCFSSDEVPCHSAVPSVGLGITVSATPPRPSTGGRCGSPDEVPVLPSPPLDDSLVGSCQGGGDRLCTVSPGFEHGHCSSSHARAPHLAGEVLSAEMDFSNPVSGLQSPVFQVPAHVAGMVVTVLSSEVQNTALAREVAVLLVKGAVELVPPQCMMEGYYSRYFLVPR